MVMKTAIQTSTSSANTKTETTSTGIDQDDNITTKMQAIDHTPVTNGLDKRETALVIMIEGLCQDVNGAKASELSAKLENSQQEINRVNTALHLSNKKMSFSGNTNTIPRKIQRVECL